MNKALCLLIILFCCNSTTSFNSDWEIKKNENGITVYSRKTENSDFLELKCITHIETSLTSIVALLNDWETYPQWVYRCQKSTTLKTINQNQLIHYQTITVPWPAQDRDFVVNVQLSQDEKTKTVIQKAICKADFIHPIADYVRIKVFNATWTLIPNKDGTVELIYQLLVDPGGNIPAWIVNLAAVDGPYETTLHLKEWVKKEKYQKAKLPLIKELD